MKTRNYKIKAILKFTDGINKGSITVRASSYDEAVIEAKVKLNAIWGSLSLIDIEIIK